MPPTTATPDTPTIGELLDLPAQVFPGAFVADDIFRNAEELRGHMGDEKFFSLLNQAAGPAKWKGLARGWTQESYGQAVKAPPGDEARTRLVGALVQRLFSSMHKVAASG